MIYFGSQPVSSICEGTTPIEKIMSNNTNVYEDFITNFLTADGDAFMTSDGLYLLVREVA